MVLMIEGVITKDEMKEIYKAVRKIRRRRKQEAGSKIKYIIENSWPQEQPGEEL